MTSDAPLNELPAFEREDGKGRSDGAASGHGHGRRKTWTVPHLETVGVTDFGAAPSGESIQDGVSMYRPW